MYQTKRLHKGKMVDCKVCTPIQKPKRRERNFEPRVARKVRGLEGNIRRQMAEEIGEDELSKDFRFGLLQKYGLIAARIDRKVTKPIWKEESEWKRQKQEFHNATKGMFPQRTQFTPANPSMNQPRKTYTHPSQTALAAKVRKFDRNRQTYRPRGSVN
jgi:hypothetical protein